MQEPPRNLEPASHPAGKSLDEIVPPVPQLEQPEQRLAALAPDPARHVIEHAVKVHVLPGGQLAVQARILKHDAEALPNLRRLRDRVQAVELERTARRAEHRRQDRKSTRLNSSHMSISYAV